MLNVRKLAAIDIAILGLLPVIAEFALGVIGSLAMGIFVALRSRGIRGMVLAAYLVALGINYVPLLFHALSLRDRSRARREMDDELGADPRIAMRRYRRGSLLLLLPFVVPVLALVQRRGQQPARSHRTDER